MRALRRLRTHESVNMFILKAPFMRPSLSKSNSATASPHLMRFFRSSHIAAASLAEWADTMTDGSPLTPLVTVRKAHDDINASVTAWEYVARKSFSSITSLSSSFSSIPRNVKPSRTALSAM